mgnify:CR=1 FL=1
MRNAKLCMLVDGDWIVVAPAIYNDVGGEILVTKESNLKKVDEGHAVDWFTIGTLPEEYQERLNAQSEDSGKDGIPAIPNDGWERHGDYSG